MKYRMRPLSFGLPKWVRSGGVACAFCVILATIGGCVATVEERPARVVYVSGPPPAPMVEAPPAPAASGMLWVEGYWHWNGVQYVWIPGHWESPPAGYVWVRPSYVVVEGRHVYRAGGWRARAHVRVR